MANEPHAAPDTREERVNAAILSYLAARAAGRTPAPGPFLEAYPEVRDELADFLAAQGAIDAARAGEGALPAFGHYEVVRPISTGGFGEVYLCRDRVLRRPVAVKVLKARHAARPELVLRFQEEAQIASQLQHPSIPPVHELGRLPDGRPYFCMKLIQGRELAAELKERASPAEDLPRFLAIFQQVCQAVAYAHRQKNVLHRDLKPLNVMVGAFGEVQLMDWGLGKVLAEGGGLDAAAERVETVRTGVPEEQTQAGAVWGTLAYMPPEQARGEVDRQGKACDVFSLGAILCEILTGRPPYIGTTTAELWEQARAARLGPAFARLEVCGADTDLIALAKGCLAPEPHERPADAGTVAEAVTGYLNGVQERLRAAEVERARAEATAAGERKKRRWQLGLAAALLLLVTGGVGGGLWYTFDQERQAEDEQRRVTEERRKREAQQADVTATVEGLGRKLRARRLSEARADLERAEGRAKGHPSEELARQLGEARLHLVTVEKIEETVLGLSELSAGKPDYRTADRAFAACYAGYHVALGKGEQAAAVARITASPIREELIAGLDVWASVKAQLQPWGGGELFRLAQIADDNPTRKELRFSLILGQVLRFRAQARDQARLRDNASTVWFVSSNLQRLGCQADATALLRAGQQRHPADFWLNFTLGTQLVLTQPASGSAAEGVGYLRAAAALRPQSTLVALNLAKALADLGQNAEAFELLGRATAASPPLAEAFASRGGMHRRLLHFRAAEEDGRRALKLNPESAFCNAQLGYTLVEMDRFVEGMALCDRAVKRDPSSAEVWLARGMAWWRRQFPRRAIPDFVKAIALNPACTEAWAGLAITKADTGDVAEAERAGRRAVGLNSGSALAHASLGYALSHGRKDREAAAAFELAVKSDPQQPGLRVLQGLALFRGKRYADALRVFREVERLRPDFSAIHLNIAYTLAELNRLNEAAAACRRALKLDPRAALAHCNLGLVLLKGAKYPQGAAACRRALELDPECAIALCNLGHALGKMGQLKEAEQACRKALALDDGMAEAHQNLGLVHVMAERYEDGIACFRTAMRLSHNTAPPRTDLATLQANIAAARLGQQRLDDVVKEARAALTFDETYHAAHYVLGNALNMLGRHAEAVKPLKRAVELNPNDASYLGSLAEAYFGAGQKALAEEVFRRALNLVGDHAGTRTFLAGVAQVMGKHAEVLALLRRAVGLEQEFGDAHRFLRDVLRDSDQFAELLAFYRTAHRRFTADPSLTKALARLIVKTARLAELDLRLPAVLRGEEKPASPRELLEFVDLCARKAKKRYVAAVKFYTDATAADPQLFEARAVFSRYDAACAAVLAASGVGVGAGGLSAQEQTTLRVQAHRWATAELRHWGDELDRANDKLRTRLRKKFTHWKADDDLKSVRDPAALARLPAAERQAWRAFWADVEAALARARGKR